MPQLKRNKVPRWRREEILQHKFDLNVLNPLEKRLYSFLQVLATKGEASQWIRETLIAALPPDDVPIPEAKIQKKPKRGRPRKDRELTNFEPIRPSSQMRFTAPGIAKPKPKPQAQFVLSDHGSDTDEDLRYEDVEE